MQLMRKSLLIVLPVLFPIFSLCLGVEVEVKLSRQGQITLQQQETEPQNPYRYAVIVDCGSSGSRAHIFRWLTNTPPNELPAKIKPMRDLATGKPLKKSIRPGLASLRDSPSAASDYMRPLMDFVSEHVPSEAHKETRIYFMATAGLRFLNQYEQEQILDDVARDLRTQYDFPYLYTETISGIQEGIYEWLSVNAHGGRLASAYDLTAGSRNFFCQAPRSRRYGMLEMGGGSAQVTFELSPELDHIISYALRGSPIAYSAFKESQVELRLASQRDKVIKIFSATFLGLGTNSARDIAVDLLVRDAIRLFTLYPTHQTFMPFFYSTNSTLLIEDPCLPVGAQQLVRKPVELIYNQERSLGYIPRAEDEVFNVRLIGRGNYYMCQHLLNRLLVVAKSEKLNCAFGGLSWCPMSLMGTNFVPFQYLQFLGLSELFYTTKEMAHASGPYDAQKFQLRTKEICSTDFDTLMARFPEANRVDKRRVLLECFKATWILSWLHNGLKIPMKFRSDLRTLDNIDGQELDWTLGALIERLQE